MIMIKLLDYRIGPEKYFWYNCDARCFFLYYAVRWAFSPKKIYYLAQHAFAGQYDNETILHWLRTFFRRFFNQQFKRSCLPDGPKVGSVALSLFSVRFHRFAKAIAQG